MVTDGRAHEGYDAALYALTVRAGRLQYYFDLVRGAALPARRSEPWLGAPPRAIRIDAATVYVGDRDGRLWALHATDGTVQWMAKSQKKHAVQDIVMADSHVILASDRCYGFDAASGKKLWSLKLAASALLVADGVCYAVAGTDVHALQL